MNRYARTTPANHIEIVPIGRAFSNFDYIERRFSGIWPLRRIFSQVRAHSGTTMVVEKLGQPNDLREENEDIKLRHSAFTGKSSDYRLSFFTKRFSSRYGLVRCDNADFIGYAVVRSINVPAQGPLTWVYESVIRASRHQNNCVRGDRLWKCVVGGEGFQIKGHLYAQQNAITNCCAHVACRTAAARFHKDGDMSYREMNQLLGIDHVNKKAEDGLDNLEIVRVLEVAGASCFVGDYAKPISGFTPPPFQKYVYGSVESGFPGILFFGTTSAKGLHHTIPVFGHTFNEDTWVPNADLSYFRVGSGTQYIPSESWLSMFIGHDDNFGSNFCVPRHYLRPLSSSAASPSPIPSPSSTVQDGRCVAYAIGTMPKDVKINPIEAEVIGADFLFTIHPQLPADGNPWAARLVRYATNNHLVLRPILTTADQYVQHLTRVADWRRNRIYKQLLKALSEYLPKHALWLIELSIPELFSANKRKVGEVLFRADIAVGQKRDFSSFVIARLPGYFALYNGGGSPQPKYQFIPSGILDHIELYGCEPTTGRS